MKQRFGIVMGIVLGLIVFSTEVPSQITNTSIGSATIVNVADLTDQEVMEFIESLRSKLGDIPVVKDKKTATPESLKKQRDLLRDLIAAFTITPASTESPGQPAAAKSPVPAISPTFKTLGLPAEKVAPAPARAPTTTAAPAPVPAAGPDAPTIRIQRKLTPQEIQEILQKNRVFTNADRKRAIIELGTPLPPAPTQ